MKMLKKTKQFNNSITQEPDTTYARIKSLFIPLFVSALSLRLLLDGVDELEDTEELEVLEDCFESFPASLPSEFL